MGEGRLEQVGYVLLDVHLVGGRGGRAEGRADLTLLHQVEHVRQDGRMHRQAWERRWGGRQGRLVFLFSLHIYIYIKGA